MYLLSTDLSCQPCNDISYIEINYILTEAIFVQLKLVEKKQKILSLGGSER